MFRYLRAAFWAAPDVPLLGRLPLNAIAFAGFMILGFGHPGFWLLGLALESAWLFLLSNHERFQKLVDVEHAQVQAGAEDAERTLLLKKLAPATRARRDELDEKCARIVQLERDSQTEDFIIESNRQALDKLATLHLKLLAAHQTLHSVDSEKAELELRARLKKIESDLKLPALSASLRESKQATQQILQQRLANLARREQTLQEIESDLTRIEAQIDLALDNAGLRGKSETISANIKLASQLLDESSGESFSFSELERSYSSQTD
ncbi:MAG: hypothetical protein QOE70_3347 [Chthoniobacter sp.]|nr:hypothetical protein [Chthoniobacter sp.]